MPRKELIFPSMLALFIALANIFWLSYDTVPQAWDESIHLNSAAQFTDALKKGPVAFIGAFIKQENYYPPLVPALASVFGLFGKSMDGYTSVNIIFHGVLIFAVFLYARRKTGFYPACAASALAVSFPLVYTQGHFFMFDLPLTAAIMWIVLLLDDEDVFSSRKKAVMLGLVLGAAMLIKWTFWIYAAAPFLIRAVEEKRKGGKILKSIMVQAAVMAVLAAPWYIYNFSSIISKLLMYSFERGKLEGLPPVFSPASLLYYFSMLPSKAGLLTILLAAAGAAAVIMRRDREGLKLLVYFFVPVLFMTLLQNKKDRYIMPVLPFAAVAASYGFLLIKDAFYKRGVMAASLAALIFYIIAVFPLPFQWPGSARPLKHDWKIEELLSKTLPGKNIAIVPDHAYMNNINYTFYAAHAMKGAKVTGIFNFPMFADYFLVKTGEQGPFFSGADKRGKITTQALEGSGVSGSFYDKIFEAPLPDGSTALLFKRKDEIKADPAKFGRAINEQALSALSLYLKSAEKFSFRVSVRQGTALTESMRVSFSSGLLGDFRHKDAALKAYSADLEVFELLLNPEELYAGRASILSLGGIRVHSLEIREQDLSDFIKLYAKGADNIKVIIDKGRINISARYSGINAELSVSLYNPSPENPDIGFKVRKMKIGFLRIPSFIPNLMLKDYNPLLNRTNSPVKLIYKEIKLENGKMVIR